LAKLREQLPFYASPNNPLDMTASLSYDAELYANALRTVMNDENIGTVLIGYTLLLEIADPAIYYMAEGIKKVVVDAVKAAGPSGCPPYLVGVGIGGSLEFSALCAKQAAIRSIDSRNPDPQYAALEDELLTLVNKSGVGPQGLGGKNTALKVNIEWAHTHIGSMPVAVNLNCHATRHVEMIL
jgi:tartrate/fumarate subfamily iron-sulfur-dependent hydro-lyase alpha chain